MNTFKVKVYDKPKHVLVNPLAIKDSKSSPRTEEELKAKKPVKTLLVFKNNKKLLIEEPFSSFQDRLSIAQLRATFSMTPQRQDASRNLCLGCKQHFESDYDTEHKSFYHQKVCSQCRFKQAIGIDLEGV